MEAVAAEPPSSPLAELPADQQRLYAPFKPEESPEKVRAIPLELRKEVIAANRERDKQPQPVDADEFSRTLRLARGYVEADRRSITELQSGKPIYNVGTGEKVTDPQRRDAFIEGVKRSLAKNEQVLAFLEGGNFLRPPGSDPYA